MCSYVILIPALRKCNGISHENERKDIELIVCVVKPLTGGGTLTVQQIQLPESEIHYCLQGKFVRK